MKKLLIAVCCLFIAAAAHAGFDDDFKKHISAATAGDIESYARDLGLIAGVTDFHNGSTVSFPGFDVGVVANFMDPNNKIDSDADNDYVFMPMVYGNAKLPILGLNLSARGTSYDGLTSIGGGLKWSLVGASILPFFPDITAGAFYDRMKTDYYSADHFSASVSASVKVLILEPYVGVGYDYTDLEVKSTGTSFDGKSYDHDGTRFTAGLNVTPFPFLYVFGSYTQASSTKIYQAGVGARF
ncbi:hypothetical protein AAIR98_001796 [Elusimicrobium simillimum]|uniref:hypothetical protein n=1 Tax=Elusimicrobium simillimum TaxID=3143438 RepID=UPI003C704710